MSTIPGSPSITTDSHGRCRECNNGRHGGSLVFFISIDSIHY
ncbi:hypothetical protein CAter282_4181 [Collimonas arenae]|uniref:Uncharacterized protein n=1 Tax=Collimonas arenae TaxID=279058 RepID=A0A127PW42_9BURK|nr:hypothetical protein CAter10_4552 [Collimonas arenae]AMP11841.1 hypothetical protein CAter282_4181 [Collimonas arenae]